MLAPQLSREVREPRASLAARPIKCRACGNLFARLRPLQVACSLDCAQVVARQQREKAERRETLERKRALKTWRQLVAETQAACNRYVRLRDAGKPCICCGKPLEPDRPGGGVDAGHYLSVGSAPELRFNLDNIHAQRKSCNRPGGTTRAAFRAGMIERIGPERLAALEGPHAPHKPGREELVELRRQFNAMANALARGVVVTVEAIA